MTSRKLKADPGRIEGTSGVFALASAALLAVVTGTWVGVALTLVHPGHGDSAFYVHMAQQIADERTLHIDYIWQYFAHPETVRHYAFDYWLPGTSLMQALAMKLLAPLGISPLVAALCPPALIAASAGLAGRVVASRHGLTALDAVSCGMLAATSALAAFMAFPLESAPFAAALYVAAGALTARALVAGEPAPLAWAFAAAATAYWFRGEALILMPFLTTFALGGVLSGRLPSRALATAFLAYAAVFVPLVSLNLTQGGFALPPTSKAIWLTEYNDLFEYRLVGYSWPPDMDTLAAMFGDRVRGIAQIVRFLVSDHRVVGLFLPLVCLAYLAFERPKNRPTTDLALAILSALTVYYLAFYALVLPFFASDAAKKATVGLFAVLTWLGALRLGELLRSPRTGMVAMFLASLFLSTMGSWSLLARGDQSNYAVRYETICARVQDDAEKITPVIMTREVWEFHYSCAIPMVMLPSGSPVEVADVVAKYNVTHLLLEAHWVGLRPELQSHYGAAGFTVGGIKFERIDGKQGRFALYRVVRN